MTADVRQDARMRRLIARRQDADAREHMGFADDDEITGGAAARSPMAPLGAMGDE